MRSSLGDRQTNRMCDDASRLCPVNRLGNVALNPDYCLSPGYAAFNNATGSPFFQEFCDLLKEEGHRDMELTRLMTRLSHRLAYTFQARGRNLAGKKQMPCLLTRMTREVFPFARPGRALEALEAPGLSATSLVQDGANMRARTPSIS